MSEVVILLGVLVGATLFLAALVGLVQAAFTGSTKSFIQAVASLILLHVLLETVVIVLMFNGILQAVGHQTPAP